MKIGVYLPEELKERMDKFSDRYGSNMTAIINIALREFFKERGF